MTDKPILYFGDTSLASAAGYLAGLLSHFQLGFDYVPSGEDVNGHPLSGRRLFILSDYPSVRMSEAKQREIVRHVEFGAGLLMIGGWESFWGQNGQWAGTPLGSILPVHIARHDDRINCDQPALVRCVDDHVICKDLPWDKRPPTIGGFNRFSAKDDATTVLEVERFTAKQTGDQIRFESLDRNPLLVVGKHGKGRTAALATDLAPHWVGGLVDWGTSNNDRVTAEAPESWSIEVGGCYAQFVSNLLSWTGAMEPARVGNKPVAETIG
jgi:hypothetical protein